MTERVGTVVIGGGQAGLVTSYHLSQRDLEHVVLEQESVPFPAWRSRWDSFTLVTPNFQLQMPEFAYEGDNPDGFLHRDDVIEYLEEFAASFDPPVRFGVRATSVERNPAGGYLVRTDNGTLEAGNVVVAIGTFQEPRIPPFSDDLSDHGSNQLVQLHSSDYRNPESLPDGGVLVVGAGQSGSQIAEELNQSGRQVYLSASDVERLPRRYRGKDSMRWLVETGFVDRTVDELESLEERFSPNPRISGKDGGHTLNLHQFARDGVRLLGHLEGAQGTRAYFAPDLKGSLATADKFAAEFKQGIDKFIAKTGQDAPEPSAGPGPQDGYEVDIVRELDLKAEGIATIIWATGYMFDFSWVKLPILDGYGYPVQKRGITAYPGLYFVGLHWLHTIKSGLLAGVSDDAKHVVEHIADD